ncbi:hypothetical protein BU23DRAFT_524813 [Bimuria novae-zelandiae CBS 107.79]|uniref:Large ribosomal subunit protein mL50 n=1 Tax=Bimuria novae-zelandiae CBS 107.79 TaxID=1447943 RepID=A0A6A5VTV3_9PLEO|nr:hypothetical protein BU23DRAFT_524813 [Bimuria novae-zelandiae CBS 107.79]
MRRIPRPQRAIDPSLPISPLIQRRIPPPACLRATIPYPHLRTTSASFSTTPTFNFLLSSKQDKKSHQAFVRRWQKRILGDSEPIGAHVDPFDPTSPVRIAPEEQGEEVEVLDDEQAELDPSKQGLLGREYEEATKGPLLHVGGKKWIKHAEEINLAKEFEKLTLRTYTPMTQDMADQIEKLSGSLYTIRDENLMMAQDFDEATGKPYTDISFGRSTRLRKPEALRDAFHQAVVEIYVLKNQKQSLDMTTQANRGIYDPPEWIKDVQLERTRKGKYILSFPKDKTFTEETLLEAMRHVPTYTPPAPEEIVEVEAPENELLAEEGAPLASEAAESPSPLPVMDPATPAFKRAALVKDDDEKPKFDFMSNRPTPRQPKPTEFAEPAKPTERVAEVVVEETLTVAEPEAANESRHAAMESAVRSAEQEVSDIREALREHITSHSSKTVMRVEKPSPAAQWNHVPFTDPALKFALAKRVAQLTGHYISDRHLTSSKNLGDLYDHVRGTANPTPTDVYTYINVEGKRQNIKRKRLAKLAKHQPEVAKTKLKINAGELLRLGNVELLKRELTHAQRRVKTGLEKVVIRELEAKHLLPGRELEHNQEYRKARSERMERKAELKEMTHLFPEFAHKRSKNATRGF